MMKVQVDDTGPIYDKGDRRFKHVGSSSCPEFRSENDPRRVVGLCPNNLQHADHQRLLNEAVPDGNGDRSIDFPKRLYVVHDGAIYRAETTDWGKSYHGYPYRGKMGRGLLEKLRAMAEEKGCAAELEQWAADYIELHGK